MPERFFPVVFAAFLLLASAVFAETPARGMMPGPAQQAGPSPSVVPQLQARVVINVKDGLLSVDVADAEFGSVMKEIAARAGIRVDMSGDILSRKITTRFSRLDLEDGISRLMTLLQEKNYTIRYDSKGNVNSVDIAGGVAAAPSSSKTSSRPAAPAVPRTPAAFPASPVSGVQKNPPPQRRLIPPPGPLPSETIRDRGMEEPAGSSDEGGEDDLPYIPPRKSAVPAPK